jgi:hypothetical protein
MRFYVSKPITDAFIAELEDNYNTYLQDIADTSKILLDELQTLRVGADYASTGLAKPSLLLNPLSLEIDDEAVGIVSAKMMFEAIFIVDGFAEDDAIVRAELYADALIGMVTSDDFLGGEVTHASVPRVEYFPGGSGTSRYAVLDVEITLEQGRD